MEVCFKWITWLLTDELRLSPASCLYSKSEYFDVWMLWNCVFNLTIYCYAIYIYMLSYCAKQEIKYSSFFTWIPYKFINWKLFYFATTKTFSILRRITDPSSKYSVCVISTWIQASLPTSLAANNFIFYVGLKNYKNFNVVLIKLKAI